MYHNPEKNRYVRKFKMRNPVAKSLLEEGDGEFRPRIMDKKRGRKKLRVYDAYEIMENTDNAQD